MFLVSLEAPIKQADGEALDVVLLLAHVLAAGAWLVLAVLMMLMAVPHLRRIPSALGLHVLQIKRLEFAGALWFSYLATLVTGIVLLFTHAIYDPPVSGADWSALEAKSYGVPYYYALYVKIGLFVGMGVATALLTREALLTAARSEEDGGPVDLDLEFDDDAEWVTDVADSIENGDLDLVDGDGSGTTRVGAPARRRAVAGEFPDAGLWGAVVVTVVGLAGVGLCVTLIKYFHELSEAAVVYERLRGRG
jgi:hypothetical protein